jgi:hypothetical protein
MSAMLKEVWDCVKGTGLLKFIAAVVLRNTVTTIVNGESRDANALRDIFVLSTKED